MIHNQKLIQPIPQACALYSNTSHTHIIMCQLLVMNDAIKGLVWICNHCIELRVLNEDLQFQPVNAALRLTRTILKHALKDTGLSCALKPSWKSQCLKILVIPCDCSSRVTNITVNWSPQRVLMQLTVQTPSMAY